MYRCSIVYDTRPGDTFDWDYYLSHHIPLAVGRSLDHAPVTACELDRPAGHAGPPPLLCICTVAFDGADGPETFQTFLTNPALGADVRADERNYTGIVPSFSIAQVEPVRPRTATSGFRVRAVFPYENGASVGRPPFDRDAAEKVIDRAAALVALQGAEIDRCYAGLVPGSHPAKAGIFSLYAAAADEADLLRRGIEGDLAALRPGPMPDIIAARVIDFDLAATWRGRGPKAAGAAV